MKHTVECGICGHRAKRITSTHLLFAHNMTIAEYKELFPSRPLISDETREKISEAALARYKAKPMSQETRQKISESQRRHWEVLDGKGKEKPKSESK